MPYQSTQAKLMMGFYSLSSDRKGLMIDTQYKLLTVTDKIVGHQLQLRMLYPFNQIQILVFYIFHMTKTRLPTFLDFICKHYPFVSHTDKYLIIVEPNIYCH